MMSRFRHSCLLTLGASMPGLMALAGSLLDPKLLPIALLFYAVAGGIGAISVTFDFLSGRNDKIARFWLGYSIKDPL